MPARRKKSLQQGKAKLGAAIYHNEHRSKKGRHRKDRLAQRFKMKKLLLLQRELDLDASLEIASYG
jgi:hypothetical protein